MLYLKTFQELLDILKEGVRDEECGHVSYISDPRNITMLLEKVNKSTNAIPDFIDFNNLMGDYDYYSFSFDYEDGELKYSISPATDDDGEFYSDYGLCLVDECVPDNFEEEYRRDSDFIQDYESPIRVCWGEEPDEDFMHSIKDGDTEIRTRVDTDDEGTVTGFTKSWKDKNSHFTYSYHSTDESDVLNLMKKFDINNF